MTRLKCCACHEKWRWTRRKCCACHENCNTSCENVAKVLRLPHKTTFDTLQNTSESATPATRNEATRRLKPPKMIPPAELTIGTAIRSSHGRLRTVANGCGRLRPQTQRRANTPSTPRPPEWNGNPCYAFGKNLWSSVGTRTCVRCRTAGDAWRDELQNMLFTIDEAYMRVYHNRIMCTCIYIYIYYIYIISTHT